MPRPGANGHRRRLRGERHPARDAAGGARADGAIPPRPTGGRGAGIAPRSGAPARRPPPARVPASAHCARRRHRGATVRRPARRRRRRSSRPRARRPARLPRPRGTAGSPRVAAAWRAAGSRGAAPNGSPGAVGRRRPRGTDGRGRRSGGPRRCRRSRAAWPAQTWSPAEPLGPAPTQGRGGPRPGAIGRDRSARGAAGGGSDLPAPARAAGVASAGSVGGVRRVRAELGPEAGDVARVAMQAEVHDGRRGRPPRGRAAPGDRVEPVRVADDYRWTVSTSRAPSRGRGAGGRSARRDRRAGVGTWRRTSSPAVGRASEGVCAARTREMAASARRAGSQGGRTWPSRPAPAAACTGRVAVRGTGEVRSAAASGPVAALAAAEVRISGPSTHPCAGRGAAVSPSARAEGPPVSRPRGARAGGRRGRRRPRRRRRGRPLGPASRRRGRCRARRPRPPAGR